MTRSALPLASFLALTATLAMAGCNPEPSAPEPVTSPAAANLRASQRRAEVVRDWLVENGVAEDRIDVIAFGEQNPVSPNANPDGTPDEAGRAKNRRVDLTIAVPPGTPPAAAATDEGTLVEEITGPVPAASETPKE